jgi:hypothetical protein
MGHPSVKKAKPAEFQLSVTPTSLLVRDGMAEAMPFPVVFGDRDEPQR